MNEWTNLLFEFLSTGSHNVILGYDQHAIISYRSFFRTFLPKNWPYYPLDLAQRHQHLPQGHPGAGLCHPPGGRYHLRRFRRSHPDRHEGRELPDQAVRAAGRIYGQVCFLLREERNGLRGRGLQHVHGCRQRQVWILKRGLWIPLCQRVLNDS